MRFKSVLCTLLLFCMSLTKCLAVDKETSDRLNSEIYEIAENVINDTHIHTCFNLDSNLSRSAAEQYTPLIPIALTECETGSWTDRSITWSSAIYSSIIGNSIDWSDVSVYDIDESFYNINLLSRYTECGSNCTSSYHSRYNYGHTGSGRNDNDSLGCLQVLRRYLQDNDGVKRYNCGVVVTDLMSWEDSVQFFFHEHGGRVLQCTTSNNSRTVETPYELVALVAVSHNSGSSFLSSGSAGNTWYNADAVFNLCDMFSKPDVVSILNHHIDEWFVSIEPSLSSNRNFALLGQSTTTKLDSILSECGIDLSRYSSSVTFKQYYPIRTVLNYMALERLYDTIS